MAVSKAGAISLTGIEDTLALILECSNNQSKIEALLLPSLRKLCSPPKSQTGGSGSRDVARHQRGPPHGIEEVLCHPIQGDVDPLSVLDPAVHSLGMLYILAARVHHVSNDTPQYAAAIFPHINAFIQRFSLDQVQPAADKVTQLAAGIARITQAVQDPNAGFETIRNLFDRFVTVPNNLTTLHPLLAYQYLRTRKYAEAATDLLDTPLIDADTSITALKSSDVLEYFYYAGLIYTKLERYTEAMDAFETCVSSPAVAVSAIHMDAYKKLVLVQLLAHGKTVPLPSYTPSVVVRTFKQIAQPYLSLASAYETYNDRNNDTAALQKLVQQKFGTFQQDRNLGLVQKCLSQHRQRTIQKLGDVYSVISVARIASLVGLTGEDAEQTVVDDLKTIASRPWMNDGQCGTTLIDRPGHPLTVQFSHPSGASSGQTFDSQESAKLLNAKIGEAKHWQSLVEARDRQIGQSTAYLTRAFKSRDHRYLHSNGAQLGMAGAGGAFSKSTMADDFDEGDDDDDADY